MDSEKKLLQKNINNYLFKFIYLFKFKIINKKW